MFCRVYLQLYACRGDTGSPLGTWLAHSDAVSAVHCMGSTPPDSISRLLTASWDGAIKLWECAPLSSCLLLTAAQCLLGAMASLCSLLPALPTCAHKDWTYAPAVTPACDDTAAWLRDGSPGGRLAAPPKCQHSSWGAATEASGVLQLVRRVSWWLPVAMMAWCPCGMCAAAPGSGRSGRDCDSVGFACSRCAAAAGIGL